MKALILHLLRVPPEPSLPEGSSGSARVFRASRKYLQLKLLRWGVSQGMNLVGLVFALVALNLVATGQLEVLESIPHRPIILRLLGWVEIFGIVAFVAQLPVTFLLVRLDFEMRWYIVTDRSLRIREGVWKVNEMTMTFDNVQDVAIRQGPIQRLFGISNLRVRTAGGGANVNPHEGQSEEKSGHIGYFRGVDNAAEIRDLVLERLKRIHDAGLGDPDLPGEVPETPVVLPDEALVGAAREMLAEVRLLRRSLVN